MLKTVAKVVLRNPFSFCCNNHLEITDLCVQGNIIECKVTTSRGNQEKSGNKINASYGLEKSVKSGQRSDMIEK